jgi:hypothetical protein
MGIASTQGLSFRLVANGTQLDLFKDEDIFISDNITGLFDIGDLPSDFSRQVTLPGTKINNAFFEHVYDISVTNPFLFATNVKVNAYFDMGGFYISSGYLQLNKVNVIANKFIDSYEVTIYGSLSSFAREINRSNLNNINPLGMYTHTASYDNIKASWTGGLFNGDIVYPMADYGKNIEYEFTPNSFGINNPNGALGVKDFKPAIRVMKVWDAIFRQYGYTYESDFLTSSFFDDMYMICNYGLQYPVFNGVDLETDGIIKIGPISGSSTDVTLTVATPQILQWENTQIDPSGKMSDGAIYTTSTTSSYSGELKIKLRVSGSAGQPQLELQAFGDSTIYSTYNLPKINEFFRETRSQNQTGDKTYTLAEKIIFDELPGNTPINFRLKYDYYGGTSFTVTVAPGNDESSYLAINNITNNADDRIMEIAPNLPYGTQGIKMIDFIKGMQKKFNLIIYPSKTKSRHFIVETFNSWYKKGEIKDFNKYINLDNKIEVIPANNLAVNKLDFGDSLGVDYIAQQFAKANNREFGKAYYVDNENFFSQGQLKVETTFEVSPLRYLPGTGVSGSLGILTGLPVYVVLGTNDSDICYASYEQKYTIDGDVVLGSILYNDINLTSPVTGYSYVRTTSVDDVYRLNPVTGRVGSYYSTCFFGGGGGGPSS